MRALLRSACPLSLLIASSASAVTMAWTPIGDPGNAADTRVMNDGTTGYGSVPDTYSIGTYEVTNAQYAEFLNAKAPTDSLGLYNPYMGNPGPGPSGNGGITRSGSPGSYIYSAIAERGDMPVNWVSWYDAARFANWMNNGQGSGDTETGAYTLLGGTATPSNADTVARNAGATILLPSENEWYKAAYFAPSTASYFEYPTASNTETICTMPTAAANSANCDNATENTTDDLTNVGSYTGSPSSYGTFDQGGNVWEWNEFIFVSADQSYRGVRGGGWVYGSHASYLAASNRYVGVPDEQYDMGFRVAMIPEPGTGLLVIAGLFGLAGWRRASA